MPSFSSPFEALVEHCKDNDIKCHVDHDKKFIGFAMCGDAVVYKVHWRITNEDELLQMDLAIPVHARDAKLRPLALETVVRANHGLAIGNFNIDLSDGEITYHISCPINEAALEDEMIGRLFTTAMATAERYFPAFMKVFYGGHTPEDAVYLSELELHSARLDEGTPGSPKAAEEKSAQTPSISPPKKGTRVPRKKNQTPKSGDQPGLFDPAKGEGTDRPQKDR
ncbi:MAG: hypothetical protein RIR25_85 [Verrucomicrobiota bacterium]|jgi:hypothetical protein